jgi:hypothetical protein
MDRQRKAAVSIQLKDAVRISSGREKKAATAPSLPLVAALTGSQPNWEKEQTVAAGVRSPSTAVARTNTHLHLALILRGVPVVPQNMDAARTERQWLRAQMGRAVLDAKLQRTDVVPTTLPQLLDQTQRAVVVQAQHMAAAQMG